MDENKILEQFKEMADNFSINRKERKAYMFMPTFEGFEVYELSEETGRQSICLEKLKRDAELHNKD